MDKKIGVPPEWFFGLDVLTAKEVRELPLASAVMVISADRHGEKQTLDCAVVRSGNKKVLAYRDGYGDRATMQITEYPRKWYAVRRKSA